MGTAPDSDVYEAGVVCPTCEIILFEDITPKYVEVYFENIEACFGIQFKPPNGFFLLEQWIGDPCRWRHTCDALLIEWSHTAIDSGLTVSVFMQSWFAHIIPFLCKTDFVNQNDCANPNVIGHGGTGSVKWGPNIGPPGETGYEVGLPCGTCNAILFNCNTPKYVRAEVTEIHNCAGEFGSPPNGFYFLVQTLACEWQITIGNFTLTWSLHAMSSGFTIVDSDGDQWFYDSINISCQQFFTGRTPIACLLPNVSGWGGEVLIKWGPGIPA